MWACPCRCRCHVDPCSVRRQPCGMHRVSWSVTLGADHGSRHDRSESDPLLAFSVHGDTRHVYTRDETRGTYTYTGGGARLFRQPNSWARPQAHQRGGSYAFPGFLIDTSHGEKSSWDAKILSSSGTEGSELPLSVYSAPSVFLVRKGRPTFSAAHSLGEAGPGTSAACCRRLARRWPGGGIGW